MMEDKSSAAEGSGIFESLFGGFSNGLSIFSNNPFRRKAEVVVASGDRDDASAGGAEGEGGGSLLKSLLNEGLIGEEAVDIVAKAATVGNISDSTKLKAFKVKAFGNDGNAETAIQYQGKKKPKGADVEEEKDDLKRSRSQDGAEDPAAAAAADGDGENSRRTGSSEGRKRKQDPSPVQMEMEAEAVEEATGSTESKQKKQRKKSTGVGVEVGSSGVAEPEQQLVPRQSARNLKKRQKQEQEQQQLELLSGEGEQKLRKKGKSSSTAAEADKDSSKLGGKRSQEGEGRAGGGGVDKNKKKLKRLKEVEPFNETGATATATTITPIPGMETRSGTKRKKGSSVEELYEKRRRETVEGGMEVARLQPEHGSGEAQEGGSSEDATALAEKLRRKRKSGDDMEQEMQELEGGKRKKTTRTTRDNEERLKRTVFVGNLPVTVKAKHLSREFSQFGHVESARLRSVPLVDTKMPRKAAVITGKLNESRTSLNGYVVFENEESARAALAHNMTLFNGKHLRVDMATAPRKGDNNGGDSGGIEYDRTRSIFVGNLPFDVEDEEVYSLFEGKSPDLKVDAVRVVRDPQTSAGKGFAFVCFKTKVGARNALDNAEHTKLRNRKLRIIRFGFQVNRNRGKELPAKTTRKSYGSKPTPRPRPGAEQRLSKRGVSSYEGARASKADGRPGKRRDSFQSPSRAKYGKPGGNSKRGTPGKKSPMAAGKRSEATKRPAVAARKAASQAKASGGNVGTGGGKRKRADKGMKTNKKKKSKK